MPEDIAQGADWDVLSWMLDCNDPRLVGVGEVVVATPNVAERPAIPPESPNDLSALHVCTLHTHDASVKRFS